jgi:hypothetical protein
VEVEFAAFFARNGRFLANFCDLWLRVIGIWRLQLAMRDARCVQSPISSILAAGLWRRCDTLSL